MMRAVLPFMRRRRAGHVVNITSVSGLATWAGTGSIARANWRWRRSARRSLGSGRTGDQGDEYRARRNAHGLCRRCSVATQARISDYDGTARQAKLLLADHAGHEAGDPARVAQAILQAVDADHPPLRLLLGADALHYAEAQIEGLQQEIETWKAITLSTAYPDT